jgi:hypothetical protein
MSNNTLFFQRINPGDPPTGTVLAANIKELERGWVFIDDPVVGEIKINYGKAYCIVPFFDPDDQSPYREPVTHFICLTDLERRIDIIE